MSLDSAKAFIEKMKSDAAFKERVLGVEDVAERLSLISSEGFDCTEEEIKQVSGELSEEELYYAEDGPPLGRGGTSAG
jgi:predicted ribosomally synthesized peptide with nif11-like leader